MEVDEDLGSLLVDELIPYSIEYYLGIKEEAEPNDQKAIKEDDETDFSDDDDAPKKKAVKGKKKK